MIQLELAGLTQRRLEDLVAEATEKYRVEVNARYRILSFTSESTNAHLWRKYADNFSGIVLQFFVDPLLGSAYEVMYSNEYPALDITSNEGFDALIQTALVKRVDWAPEAEYRLIFGEPPIGDDAPLVQQRWQFPEKLLTGVIFGERVNADQRLSLLNLARFRDSKLNFYTAYEEGEGRVRISQF